MEIGAGFVTFAGMSVKQYLLGQALIMLALLGLVTAFHWAAGAMQGPGLVVNLASVVVAGAVTTAAYLINLRGLQTAATRQFLGSLLAAMAARFIVSLLYVTFIALKTPVDRTAFALTYFLAFFSFLFFEVYALMDNLRPKK